MCAYFGTTIVHIGILHGLWTI